MKTTKKLFCVILCLLTIFITCQAGMAHEGISVVLDGEKLNFDVPPQIINGRTMVPFRAIFEAMGIEVKYDSTFNDITAETEHSKITIDLSDHDNYERIIMLSEIRNRIGSYTSYGTVLYIPIDTKPVIIDGRTLVPVRIIAEILGCDVSWDASTQTVSINSVKEDGCFVTVYNANGEKKRVPISEYGNYIKNKWFLEPCQTFYGLAGDTTVGPVRRAQDYIDLGWYAKNETTLYAPDGRELVVSLDQVKAHLNVGWYMQPMTTVYTLSGSLIPVKCSELDEHLGKDWYNEPMKILHSSDNRAIVVGTSVAEDYKKVGWYDKDSLKNGYSLNTEEGIKKFIKDFYPVVVTATGRYTFDISTWELDGVIEIDLEYDYDMINDATYNTAMGVEQRVQAKKDIKQYMYIMANDIMKRTNVPVEIQFERGGYEYPALKVGYSSTYFLTSKNYQDVYVTASDGSSMRTRNIVGFHWTPLSDDYDFDKV